MTERTERADIRSQKKALRAACREKRAGVSQAERQRRDGLICGRIAKLPAFKNAETVLLYAPMMGEIDLLPLVSLCHRLGKQVGLPVTDKESGRISFFSPAPGAKLTPGAYGILEPPEGSEPCRITEHTLCLLPGMSFDPRGNRLGYGGGYYDRFLRSFPGVTVGAVYETLMTPALPAEETDIAVSLVVTERGVIDCGRVRARAASPQKTATDRRPSENKPKNAAQDTAQGNVWRVLKARSQRLLASALAPIRAAVSRRLRQEDEETPELQRRLLTEEVKPLHAPPILVLVCIGFLLLSRLIDSLITRRGGEYVSVILLQLLIFLLPAILYIQLRGERFPARIRLQGLRPEHLWFCLCCLVAMISGSLLINILTGGIGSLGGNFTLYDTFVARINGRAWEAVYVILAYCLLPAFCEELVFRSVLCAEYEASGSGVAVIVSGVFFAMMHLSLPLFPNYLFCGMLLAAVMYTTRSMLASVLLHFLYNLFCLFGQPYLSEFYVTAGSGEIFIFCLVVLFLLFAAFATGEARKIYHLYAKANLDSGYTVPVRFAEYPKRLLRVLATPAFVVLAAVFLGMAIYALY